MAEVDVPAKDPAEKALQAKTISTVGTRAILALHGSCEMTIPVNYSSLLIQPLFPALT